MIFITVSPFSESLQNNFYVHLCICSILYYITGHTNKEIKKCDSWNDCLEKNYFSYLTDKLNVKGIVIRLREGGLISRQLQDEIEGTRSGHEANALYIKHLIRNGIKDTFRTFVNILRDSSEEFNIHGEIASTFRQDPMLNTVVSHA